MAVRRWYRPLMCAICALAAAVTAIFAAVPLEADGRILDLLIAARAFVFPTDEASLPTPVAVIALDARSLHEPGRAIA